MRFHLPRSEPRRVGAGALVHYSLAARQKLDPSYAPINLPPLDRVVIEGPPPERPASADEPADDELGEAGDAELSEAGDATE